MSTFTVDATQTAGLAEIAASLPLSLAPAREGAPELASVSGSAGWAGRAQAAFDGGALAAVVGSPATDDPEFPAGAESRLVLAWDFAANPGVLAAAEAAAPLRGRAVFAEATLSVPSSTDLDAALLDALTAVVRVAGEVTPLRTLHRDAAGWHLAGDLAGPQGARAPLALAIVVTDAAPAALRLRLLTDDGGLTAEVPSPDTAAPAGVRIVGPDGERLLPTLWETSRRASWRRAVAIAAGEALSADVAELHRVAALTPIL
ncbi:hypothetical protein [Sinomonas sp. P47F7]|uniref:hypothetical protein n=1 Tax=Sinomonas sp. P47F7 TaxID=3410987 RepID=UPI003BF5120C